jgi:hypothetical protein
MIRNLLFRVKIKVFLLMEIHKGRKEQETKNHFVEKVFYILVFYLFELFSCNLSELLDHKLYLLWNSFIVLIKADLLYKI